MDLIYIVGKDPLNHHIELKYSIRSMYNHLIKFDRIFIVGECPSFLKNVIHIPAEDRHRHNPDGNIYQKILAACNNPDISQHFFCASDDHFLLKDLYWRRYPYFYCAEMEHTVNKLGKLNYYKPHLQATYEALVSRNLPTRNFNVHLPIIYNKEIFIELMGSYDWNIPKGYTAKSLYANTLKITGVFTKDNKIHTPKTKTAIYRAIKDSLFFSTNEHAINAPMLEVLEEIFPTPSPFEN